MVLEHRTLDGWDEKHDKLGTFFEFQKAIITKKAHDSQVSQKMKLASLPARAASEPTGWMRSLCPMKLKHWENVHKDQGWASSDAAPWKDNCWMGLYWCFSPQLQPCIGMRSWFNRQILDTALSIDTTVALDIDWRRSCRVWRMQKYWELKHMCFCLFVFICETCKYLYVHLKKNKVRYLGQASGIDHAPNHW